MVKGDINRPIQNRLRIDVINRILDYLDIGVIKKKDSRIMLHNISWATT